MNGKVRGDPKKATVKIYADINHYWLISYHFTSDWYHFYLYLFLICIDFTDKYKINIFWLAQMPINWHWYNYTSYGFYSLKLKSRGHEVIFAWLSECDIRRYRMSIQNMAWHSNQKYKKYLWTPLWQIFQFIYLPNILSYWLLQIYGKSFFSTIWIEKVGVLFS